ncbi:tRNA-binding protein [Myroides odoratus]
MENTTNTLTWDDFMKVEMRVGTIMQAEEFKEVRNPAYKLVVDFGEEIGLRKTSAQITKLYTPEELIGKQVIAVVNFPPKQIANIMSECLVMGAVEGKEVTLMGLDKPVKNGLRIG